MERERFGGSRSGLWCPRGAGRPRHSSPKAREIHHLCLLDGFGPRSSLRPNRRRRLLHLRDFSPGAPRVFVPCPSPPEFLLHEELPKLSPLFLWLPFPLVLPPSHSYTLLHSAPSCDLDATFLPMASLHRRARTHSFRCWKTWSSRAFWFRADMFGFCRTVCFRGGLQETCVPNDPLTEFVRMGLTFGCRISPPLSFIESWHVVLALRKIMTNVSSPDKSCSDRSWDGKTSQCQRDVHLLLALALALLTFSSLSIVVGISLLRPP